MSFSLVLKQLLVRESLDCLGNLGSKYGLDDREGSESLNVKDYNLESIPSSFNFSSASAPNGIVSPILEEITDVGNVGYSSLAMKNGLLKKIGGYYCDSIEVIIVVWSGLLGNIG